MARVPALSARHQPRGRAKHLLGRAIGERRHVRAVPDGCGARQLWTMRH